MEVVLKGASDRKGFGGLVLWLRVWFAEARHRAGKARAERRAERELIRYHRALAGMSDHMRRDVGLPPRLFQPHLVLFERLY